MAVDQTFVNNLRTDIQSKIFAFDKVLFTRLNNGIPSEKSKKDLTRLYSLYRNLENYDVTESYFSETHILNIEKEFSIFCGSISLASVATNSAAASETTTTTLGKEVHYYHTAASLISVDNGDSGIDLDATPASYLDVYINGVYMQVGDGVKTKDIYFSSDGGATAKNIANLASGDSMYYNALLIGTDLEIGDEVKFEII